MNKLSALLLCVLLAVGTAACGTEPIAPAPDDAPSVQYATQNPDSLQNVIDLIYENVQIDGLSDAGDATLQDLFYLDSDLAVDYCIRYASGRYGVADVAIIQPAEDRAEEVVAALESRRDDRIAEFESYDVYDALDIAKNAEIFTRGDYVIMLMLPDTGAARTVILEQIPG